MLPGPTGVRTAPVAHLAHLKKRARARDQRAQSTARTSMPSRSTTEVVRELEVTTVDARILTVREPVDELAVGPTD